MSLQRDVRHGLRIGRAEFVRSVREYFRDRRRIIGLGFVLLFIGGNSLFALPVVYATGRAVRSAGSIPYFGFVATALPVALLLFAALRTAERIGNVDAEELILMAVHPRAAVIGLISSEIALLALWIGGPLGAVVAVFALGLGSPTLIVTVGLVFVPLLCWAAVWGYAFGIGVLRLFRWLPRLRRFLKVGWFLALIPLFVGTQFLTRWFVEGTFSVEALLSGLAFEPMGGYVTLAFAGTPLSQPTTIGAVGMLGSFVVLTPIGLALATRQATVFWFTDGGNTTGTTDHTKRGASDGFTAPPPFSRTAAGRIAWGHLLRGVRQPQEFAHLLIPLLVIGSSASGVMQSSGDALGVLLAGIGVVLGVYFSGATFGLNPLGDDRPQFPLLLLSKTDPGTLVQSRVAAGLAVGIPVVSLIPLATILLGTSVLSGLVFAAVGALMCPFAALFAVGIGAAYPIYEEREFWGTETVIPSSGVMMAYLFVVGPGTVIGLATTWIALTGTLVLTPRITVGLGMYLLLSTGVPYGSYRYAVRRYRRYTMN